MTSFGYHNRAICQNKPGTRGGFYVSKVSVASGFSERGFPIAAGWEANKRLRTNHYRRLAVIVAAVIVDRAPPALALALGFLYTMPAMSELSKPAVPKWPFFIADTFMLGVAWFVYSQGKYPLPSSAIFAICACVALGAFFALIPFLLEYRLTLKLVEAENLTTAVQQIKNLEDIATQINLATGLWQTVQAHSGKTVTAAKEIGDRMTTEAKNFAEFMQKASDSEKGILRLEVDKLRRSEGDWIQVVIRMLDHTFALHSAAVRSGKSAVVEQLTQFQNALRDSARRVGLTPFTTTAGEAFDATKHQVNDTAKPEAGALVGETLATGYSFRGQFIRPALVTIAAAQPEQLTTAGEATDNPPVEQEPTLL